MMNQFTLPWIAALLLLTVAPGSRAEEQVMRLRESVVSLPQGRPSERPGATVHFPGPLGMNPPAPPPDGNNGIGSMFPLATRFSNDALAWTKHAPGSTGINATHYQNEKARFLADKVFTVLTAQECRDEFKDIRDKTSAALALAKTELITAVKEIPREVLESPSNDLRMKKIARETAEAQLEARDKTIVDLKAAAEKQAEKIDSQAKQILEITEQLKDLKKRLPENPPN